MVRIDRIVMQGFKSFANRVLIPLPTGFNCIAGPNGSGKSNVIDALTFVLGTTSARVIRAQKLQNLLFNGAKSRKPADYCEVSLYIDNSDHKIPGEAEMKVTRRITRSGISVYKINGRTVTRTKVVETLSYAGLSPDGYNIIMQGDVTRIIEMSPQERRGIIDDISGIAEFDDKKEKAMRELEKVDLRVRESMIVVAEKQKMINRLREEKESAEKYQKLNGEFRKAKATLLKKRKEDGEEKIGALDKDIAENQKKFDSMEKEFAKVEADLEKMEKSIKKKTDEILARSKNYELLRKIDSMQTEMIRKRDKIDLNTGEIERLHGLAGAGTVIQAVLDLGDADVYGTVSSLIDVPKKYDIAMEVALGRHAYDIVVRNDEAAARCIKFLKEKKLGRARFIPLNKIQSRKRNEYRGQEKIIGYALDLIKYEKKYHAAMEYVLGSTLIVGNIDTARKIPGFRSVTLDGDMVEASGAMIGGFYLKKRTTSFSGEISRLRSENENLQSEIGKLEKEVEKDKGLEKEESADVVRLQKEKDEEEKRLEEERKKRRSVYDERMFLQGKISRDRIEKARAEAVLDNVRLEYAEYKDVREFFASLSQEELTEKTRSLLMEINRLGPVNLRSIEEFMTTNVEFEEMKKSLDRLIEEKNAIIGIVTEVEQKRYAKFMETFSSISLNFSKIYHDLTGGGVGRLRLEEENNIDSGLAIEASPVGKKVLNLDVMSGGEKTLTSLAFLFAIMQHSAAPFYVLDEIDAALDKANTNKVAKLIKNYSGHVQFIVITHNDITIAEADNVFGVSMEDGVSRVFGIRMPA